MTGGSAGSAGYDFQARVIAYVAAHILAAKPLSWLDDYDAAVPIAVSAETGGAGDDLAVELTDSDRVLETQVKRGLRRDVRMRDAFTRLARGIAANPSIWGVLVVDETATTAIRRQLPLDLRRIRQGRTDGLKPITKEIATLIGTTVPTADVYKLMERIRLVVLNLENDSVADGQLAVDLLGQVLQYTVQARLAWDVLIAEGLRLSKERGRRDAAGLYAVLRSKGIDLAPPQRGAGLSATTRNATWRAVPVRGTSQYRLFLDIDVSIEYRGQDTDISRLNVYMAVDQQSGRVLLKEHKPSADGDPRSQRPPLRLIPNTHSNIVLFFDSELLAEPPTEAVFYFEMATVAGASLDIVVPAQPGQTWDRVHRLI